MLRHTTLVLAALSLVASLALADDNADSSDGEQDTPPVPAALDFTVIDIHGNEVPLSNYLGKVVLFVNVASKCGYTRQYETLEALYEQYKDRGLVILGFPCNQFKQQEPGTNDEILQFCRSKYGVTFDMFAKVNVNTNEDADEVACPLYAYLTSDDCPVEDKGPVKWNFEKFLVDREGDVVARYRSKVEPDSEEMAAAIEAALGPAEGAAEGE